MKKLFSAKNITYISLIFLLIWRLLTSIAIYWRGEIGTPFGTPYWEDVAFLCSSYSLFTIILWINKGNLHTINIDKNFIILFIVMGGIYSLVIPVLFGALFGIATIFNLGILFSDKSQYAKNELSYLSIGMFLAVWLVLDFIYFILVKNANFSTGTSNLIDLIFWANPPLIVAEEFLFRGLLWKCLLDFKFSENKVIYIQAFLFWLLHFYLGSTFFWLFLPLTSVLYGYLVARAKSITPGIFLHLLHNIFSFVFR
jgi:membrane protease YdiL (CAAX protease family)